LKLASDWKLIAKKAWSFRLGILAALLSGAEIILPLFVDAFPRHIFAILSFITVMSAVFARLVAQKGLDE